METIIFGFLAIISAVLINTVATPVIIKLAHRRKWYDLPDHRKIHTGLIPRLGGIGIFLSFLLTSLLIAGIYYLKNRTLIGILDLKLLPIFLAFTLIHVVGLIDDFFNMRALVKLFFQVVAAVLVTLGGFFIKTITIPYLGTYSLGWFGYPITIFWIIGATNAVNLVDGMDGLAGGIAAFASFSMGVIALIQGSPGAAVVAFALFGGIVGFLVFNLPPAKIFMGDAGSLFLGFSLSVLPFLGISKAASFGTMIVPITLLIVPIIDTLAAIIRRVKEKRGILSPDRGHIHHKLLDLGFSEKKILVLIYSVCFYLSMIAITSVIMPKESNVYVILIVWVGSMIGYGLIHYINSRGGTQGASTRKKGQDTNTA